MIRLYILENAPNYYEMLENPEIEKICPLCKNKTVVISHIIYYYYLIWQICLYFILRKVLIMLKKRKFSVLAVSAIVTLALGVPVFAANTSSPTSGSVTISNSSITPMDEEREDGGTWDYGTSVSGFNSKTVHSNYWHPSKNHHSSCAIGTKFDTSGSVAAKKTSTSSATGSWGDLTNVYWGID